MKITTWALTGMVLVIALSGCSTRGGLTGDEAEGEDGAAGRGRGKTRTGQYSGSGYGYGRDGAGDLDSPSGPLSKRVIYFAYDSDDVLPESQAVLMAHAEYLATHPAQTAILDGHADERGSSEYNIALGERRAKSVERTMRLQGAADGQLQIVSYGEEKPSAYGHDEGSWQQNRRVEIVYPGH